MDNTQHEELSIGGNIWKLANIDDRQEELFCAQLGISPQMAKLLILRGISPQSAPYFLNPKLSTLMPNPSILKDMDKAAERIANAIINNEKIKSDYIYITSSNGIESPNDHILFNTDENMVYFRNVKTNQVSTKNISSISFMRNMGKIYNIYDLYKEIYKDEDNLESLSNPSS